MQRQEKIKEKELNSEGGPGPIIIEKQQMVIIWKTCNDYAVKLIV